jgi:hypothetical protein
MILRFRDTFLCEGQIGLIARWMREEWAERVQHLGKFKLPVLWLVNQKAKENRGAT